ncbi:MAG TPA: phosphoribosylanthranilate isomerase [Afifellaceae bacterium]|nr:phosphoribosylanthranilate isomerase [Afifellaceae bacterium]
MATRVKICGLTDAASLDAALDAGADMIGLVFFPPSPRSLPLAQGASLAARARGRAEIVALTVDADDALIAAIADEVRPDAIQFHGSERPERLVDVRRRHGVATTKSIAVAERGDLDRVAVYRSAADRLILDGKPPPDATRPGGNAARFDWGLLAGFEPGLPWLLSGGLTVENVAEAVRATGAPAVDVSSGVERAPGSKDPDLIRAFIAAVRRLENSGVAVLERGAA